MKLDDEICYCYHVSMRKLINFSRRIKPVKSSQMTQCLGAGTGCGWCIPFLIKIADDPDHFELENLTAEKYAENRKQYRSEEKVKNTFDANTSDHSKDSL